MESNTNRKRTQVHMLPTDKTGNSCQPLSAYSKPVTRGGLISASGMEAKRLVELGSQAYHLYFTTDEVAQEGDWYLFKGKVIGLANKRHGEMGRLTEHKKIIASTDPKLTVKYDNGVRDFGWETKSISYKKLPQPTQALIKAYCEQGGFDEVDVEYENIEYSDYEYNVQTQIGEDITYLEQELKVDPIHNTITTHRIVEKMYSLKEMEDIHVFVVKQGCLYEEDIWSDEHEKLVRLEFNEWIKEKL